MQCPQSPEALKWAGSAKKFIVVNLKTRKRLRLKLE